TTTCRNFRAVLDTASSMSRSVTFTARNCSIVSDSQIGTCMATLEDVFKKSGVPTHTFVAPLEYDRVLVSLRTPGRCIVVEGPSGIGKTSCIKKAIDDSGLGDSCLFLSGRKQSDLEIIKELP